MEILKLFAIDWHLMLAQLINFAIVVAVLWYFALKPLTKTMKKRNDEIKKGLDNAAEAEKKISAVEKQVLDEIKRARAEAAKILVEAQEQADKNKQLQREKTQQEIEQMLDKAKQQITQEKKLMINEVKEEIGQMVINALQRILGEKLSQELDKKYIEKVLKEIK